MTEGRCEFNFAHFVSSQDDNDNKAVFAYCRNCDFDEYLNEEEVRRLHSFLSQWLEANQNDYF